MGLYQVSSNNSPGVEFDPTPGLQVLHGIIREKNFRSLPVPSHKA